MSVLSRSVEELKATTVSKKGKIIVGTYALTIKKLIVYIKVIDIATSNIVYSKSTSTNINNEILELEGIDTTLKVYQPMVL